MLKFRILESILDSFWKIFEMGRESKESHRNMKESNRKTNNVKVGGEDVDMFVSFVFVIKNGEKNKIK